MKSRLQRILSVLCVLAMLAGCIALTAFAESADPVSRAIVVEWVDQDNYEGIRPASVDMIIDGQTVQLTEANGWTAETKVAPGSEWQIPDVQDYEKKFTGNEVVTVTYTHVPATTSFTASVVWEDNNNAAELRPETVRLLLMADGEVCRTPVDAKDSASWTDLPANKKGTTEPIYYEVVPAEVPEAYSVSITSTQVITFTLKTATLSLNASVAGVPEGADVSGLSITVTGPDPKMPMTFPLEQLAGGAGNIGTVIPGTYVAQETNGSTLIEGYVIDPANSQVGDAVYLPGGFTGTLNIKYAWKELEAEEKNEDPMSHMNSLTFEIVGPDQQLPMIVSYGMFVDGKFELDNLVPGNYAVIEKNAEGMVAAFNLQSDSVTGMVLTVGEGGTATAKLYNHYAPAPRPDEPIDIPVTKIWADDNNKDGNRPASITVILFANGVQKDQMEITAPAWTGTFTGLPQVGEDGNEIVYTVNELPVEWYVTSVNGYTITNTYQPEVTSMTVTKVWQGDGQDLNMRPQSLAVTLLPTKQVYVLNAENNWTVVANGLPTRLNGEEVTYSWKEEKVGGYTMATETVEDVTTITNTYVPIPPATKHKGKTGGDHWAFFDEYDTPLGGQLLINHVGDCFD